MNNPQHSQNDQQTILDIGKEIYTAIQRKDAESLEGFLADVFELRGGKWLLVLAFGAELQS